MLKSMIARKISAFEREWNYPMDYARELLGLGVAVLRRFMNAQAIGNYCAGISKQASYAAKILGVIAGDCGPCVQLVVDMAQRDGVPPDVLESLVAGDLEHLPADIRLPAMFARSLLARSPDLPTLRDRMRADYGTQGLVSVAFAVINASMYPVLKAALGHGDRCAKIEIDGRRVAAISPLQTPTEPHVV